MMYIEVKIGFRTFLQRDLLEKLHILLFFSTRFLPFVHSLKKHLLKYFLTNFWAFLKSATNIQYQESFTLK